VRSRHIPYLGLDDVADIDELVLPSPQRDDFRRGVLEMSGTAPLVIAETIFCRIGA